MKNRVLLIAYHFPPIQGSSGVLRTLSLVRNLPDFGWEPLVLTAHPRAYPSTTDTTPIEIPSGTVIRRAFALDTARHLAIGGKYPAFLAAPDRWWSWAIGAIPAGLRMIRQYRPQAIWSTAPLATAHMIGRTLARTSGLPWVADIRDLLTEPGDPSLRPAWKATHRIERRTLQSADRIVVVSPGQRDEYLRRFPNLPHERIEVIPNGYDEAAFEAAEGAMSSSDLPHASREQEPLTLVHSGVLYPDGRNPIPFLQALAELIDAGIIEKTRIQVVLRACGHEEEYSAMVHDMGLDEIVCFRSALPYREALEEMIKADGLILLQGRACNTAIPAKAYEYMRAYRPILGLVHPDGFTHALLASVGYPELADCESAEAIRPVLQRFLEHLDSDGGFVPSPQQVEPFSRRSGAERLAQMFDNMTGSD